ncbi:phosphotransferase [Peribacillus simplex]|uniref:phosphotransferase n=1 Tax=Peribacillus simplex TaxID=1478 RepID=UPI003D297746
MEKINEIIYSLVNQGIIKKDDDIDLKKLKSGTTNGILYTIHNNEIPKYVIKIDQPKLIAATEEFLLTYKDVNLLPNVLYTDEKKEFIVYSYISGETHFNRGSKLEWMTILIKELLNKYQKVNKDNWGRVNGIHRNSWADFNLSSLEFAKEDIGDLLPSEDHKKVESLVNKLKTYEHQEEKYYLHGDAGVHNFVYKGNKLNGVIDPMPLIGPKIYDFTYAFCSSPDDLNLETLLSSFSLLTQDVPFNKERLLEEFLFQLYTRIGVCIRVHPHDLSGYLKAWKEWREYI